MPEFANIGNESTHSLPLAAKFPPRVGQSYISGAPDSQDFHNNSQVQKTSLRIIKSHTTQLFHCLAKDSPGWEILLVASAKVK
jgi:hypothetical protein